MVCFMFSLFRSVEEEQAVGATYCEKMDDLLKESDFVVLVVNLSPETTGLISTRELNLMKPTATLVNISRGQEDFQMSLVFVKELQMLLNYETLMVHSLCLRSGCGSGRSGQSSAVGDYSCGCVRRDLP